MEESFVGINYADLESLLPRNAKFSKIQKKNIKMKKIVQKLHPRKFLPAK